MNEKWKPNVWVLRCDRHDRHAHRTLDFSSPVIVGLFGNPHLNHHKFSLLSIHFGCISVFVRYRCCFYSAESSICVFIFIQRFCCCLSDAHCCVIFKTSFGSLFFFFIYKILISLIWVECSIITRLGWWDRMVFGFGFSFRSLIHAWWTHS